MNLNDIIQRDLIVLDQYQWTISQDEDFQYSHSLESLIKMAIALEQSGHIQQAENIIKELKSHLYDIEVRLIPVNENSFAHYEENPQVKLKSFHPTIHFLYEDGHFISILVRMDIIMLHCNLNTRYQVSNIICRSFIGSP